jgi:hypothetical protein
MAVIGATQLEPVNVLGQYVQGLEAGRGARAQRQKETEALRATKETQEINALISSGALTTSEGRNQIMRTPGGLAVLESFGKTQEQMGKGTEAQTKGLTSQMEYFRRNLPFNPQAAATWLTNAYADPEVGAELKKQGTLEQALAAIPTDPAAYLRWLEGSSMFADQYVGRRVPTAEAMLPYTQELAKGVEDQQIRIALAKRPPPAITNITTTNVQERAEAGEYGKGLVAEYNVIRNRADVGRRFLPTLDQAQRALDQGLRTGFGAEAVKAGASFLAALGEPEAETKAANAELFLAAAKDNVLRRQLEQKGTQTASDAERIEETFVGLGKTPKANQFMLDVAREQINRDNEQQRFYSKWRRETKSFDGAEEAWLDGEGGKSLFNRPALKKYATPGKAAPPVPAGFVSDRPGR